MEPAGLPAFGANPITVPSLTAIPAVVPPQVDPLVPEPLELGVLGVDPLGVVPLTGDVADLPHAELPPAGLPSAGLPHREFPSAWPFADAPEEDVAALEVPGLEVPGLEVPGLEVPGLEVPGLEVHSDLPDGDVPSGELSSGGLIEGDFPVLEFLDRDHPEDDPLGIETSAADSPGVFASPFEVPAEEPSAPHPAHGRNELGLDADIAAHWDLWSAQIGRALMPTLRELGRSMQGFSCAMICTADGFNLCTLGVDEAGVLRLAALTSSMHSMADAVSQAVHGDPERRLDLLTLTDQTSTIVVLAIRDLIIGKLLLWVATEDETLGALLVRSRLAAAQVRQLLHVDEP